MVSLLMYNTGWTDRQTDETERERQKEREKEREDRDRWMTRDI